MPTTPAQPEMLALLYQMLTLVGLQAYYSQIVSAGIIFSVVGICLVHLFAQLPPPTKESSALYQLLYKIGSIPTGNYGQAFSVPFAQTITHLLAISPLSTDDTIGVMANAVLKTFPEKEPTTVLPSVTIPPATPATPPANGLSAKVLLLALLPAAAILCMSLSSCGALMSPPNQEAIAWGAYDGAVEAEILWLQHNKPTVGTVEQIAKLRQEVFTALSQWQQDINAGSTPVQAADQLAYQTAMKAFTDYLQGLGVTLTTAATPAASSTVIQGQ